jgi:uncharacterized protein YvpB
MKQIIEVPHYVQYYNIDEDKWQERSCGIVSLAMVLDYYGVRIDIDELIKDGLAKEPYDKRIGWRHSVICALARDRGLMAFRRSWSLATRDKAFFKEEGATDQELTEFEGFQLEEGIFGLKNAIDKGIPLIISVHKKVWPGNFKTKKGGHLVVLCGYFASEGVIEGFYVNDPSGPQYKHKNQLIKIDKFLASWKRQAIYVYKK